MSALPRGARIAAAALRALSRASLPLLSIALLRATDPPLTPLLLAEAVFALALVPELCARLVLRAFAAEVRVGGGVLRLASAWQRVELAGRDILRVRAFRLPLPSPGLALELAGGWRLLLASEEPDRLLEQLSRAGAATPVRDSPALAFARARATRPRRWWEHPFVKIGLASLLPAAVGFHAHQRIAFGSWLGEYYLMGPGAWLASAGRYWLTSALYLVLLAGCFRVAVETGAWLASVVSPERAALARRIGEHTASALYYASIPLLLAARFVA